LATLNGYNLEEAKRRFLQLWALYKIDRFLNGYLRLRTACEFEVSRITTRLSGQANASDGGNVQFPWPKSDEIKEDFIAAKDTCFPSKQDQDEWIQRRVHVVIYAVDIEGKAELPDGMQKEIFNLSGFEDRVSIKSISSGKGKNKKTVDAMILNGEWPKEDQEKLLDQNPEKIDGEDGEIRDNPAYSIVDKAIKDWAAKWKKQQQKQSGSEDSGE
jgi:hypothetical protein